MKRLLSLLISFMLFMTLFANSITINAALVGDVNGDGEVTKSDARIALDIASGAIKGTAAQIKACDLNGDGKVTTADVQLIMEKIPPQADLNDNDYMLYLEQQGFPQSYTESLLVLHKKFPMWEFKPFVTGLQWSDAVTGEHNPHKKQLIENNVTSIWECQCSACKGKIQEASNWVSASEQAIEYYLDPRNFLSEEYIFQFETTRYDSSHSIGAVEAILKNTWMYNSNITYYDALGSLKTYLSNGKPVKYSDAIMKAAEDSGMSAYYLASKIVQEVGSSNSSNASSTSGKKAPYNGIYNYYNIGAYTGAVDGLKWANGYMKTTAAAYMYKSATLTSEKVNNTSTNQALVIASGQTLNYIGVSGNFYRVAYTLSGVKYTGYVTKSAVSLTESYGRPWTDPYKSIYYGAQYIFDGYATYQYTGYLQKFNVNPASGNLYGHEYMANIRAAASESKKTYNAYKANGVLSDSMVFYIPVFKNMPGGDLYSVDRFESTLQTLISSSVGKTSAVVDWSKVLGATGYQIWRYNPSTKKYGKLTNTTSLTYTDSTLKSGAGYSYKVRAYRQLGDGSYIYTRFSSTLSVKTTASTPTTTNPPTTTPSTSDVAYNAKGTVNISSGTLNIRKSPDTSSAVVVAATKGQIVTITAKNGDWYKVSLTIGGTSFTGYAHSDYIAVTSVDVPVVKPACPYAEPSVTLRKGDSGDGVRWLQWHLWKLGYLAGESDVDGSFGSGTETAVKNFQQDAKIDVDGLVGSGTRAALKAKL